jgi:hypothetical protein
MQTLVIKASCEMSARDFAISRGFTVHHVLDIDSPTQFAARVTPDRELAASWFMESNSGPHELGDLLWFNDANDEETGTDRFTVKQVPWRGVGVSEVVAEGVIGQAKKRAWTGGTSPNPLAKINRFERETVRKLFREQFTTYANHWGEKPDHGTARIFWNRARHDAHATHRQEG